MKATSRVRAGLAGALAGVVLFSGCAQIGSARGGQGTPGPTASAAADSSMTVPKTFSGPVRWTVGNAVGSSIEITRHGIVGLFGSADNRRVALIDAQTGQPIWTSVAFRTDPQARLRVVHHDGRDWAVVWYPTKKNTVTVRTFDIHGTGIGDGKEPAHTEAFTGAEKAPLVLVNSRGILLRGVEEARPFILWPADGARTAYGSGPVLDGETGAARAAYNNGFLVSFEPAGFSFASSTGGWPSTAATPIGGVLNSGEIRAIEHGLILAVWRQTIGGTVIAVHSAQTGKVLAQQVVTEKQPVDEVKGPFVVAPDVSWAAFGGYLFNLHGDQRSTRWRDLHGGVPVSIYQGVVYLRNVAEPFAAPAPPCPTASPSGSPSSATPETSGSPSPSDSTSSTATPSSTPTASQPPCDSASSTTPPDDFAGYAAMDASTGVLVDQSMATVPLGVSAAGAGVFVAQSDQDAAPQLFSVALR